jgi:PKD repeat protein
VHDPENELPNVFVSADQLQGDAPLLVNFDASASNDPDGTIVSYEWRVGNEAYGSPSASPEFQYTFTNGGTYLVRCRGTDDEGARRIGGATIQVQDPENLAPIASFDIDVSSGPGPLTVSFDGSDSLDTDGTVANYYWDFDGDGDTDSTTFLPQAQFTYGAAGTYSAKLMVDDNDDAESNTATRQVSVESGWAVQSIETVDHVRDISMLSVPEVEVFENVLLAFDALDEGENALHFHVSDASAQVFDTESPNLTQSNSVASLIYLDGKPHIFYSRYEGILQAGLYYHTAADTVGLLWGGDSTLVQAGGNIASSGVAAFELGGFPAALYADYQASIYFSLAALANGIAWEAPVLVADLDEPAGLSQPHAVMAGGKPALAILGVNTNNVYFMRSTDGEFGDIESLQQPLNGVNSSSMAMGLIGGVPVIVYGDDYRLMLIRATDASAAAWGPPTEVYAPVQLTYPSNLVLADIGGVPAVAYHDSIGHKVVYVAAADANADSWLDAEVVDSFASSGFKLCLISFLGYPALAHAAITPEGDHVVRFAYRPPT